MKRTTSLYLFVLLCLSFVFAQQSTTPAPTSAVVPMLVNFSGTLTDVNGKPMTGIVGVTFSLYAKQQGGAPLWMETQNVQPNPNGQYKVMLGSTTSQGLPADLFTSGQAKWLGVQAQGQAEQPRVMLLSVPYALKAGDAATVGGLPPSAFLLAAPASSASGSTAGGDSLTPSTSPVVVGSGTPDFVPLWTNLNALGNSVLFQSGSGSSALVGINTTTPAATLDVNGGVISRGALQLPSTGTATAGQGFNSQPFSLQGSAFNSSTGKAIGPLFQWQTEPSGNDTSSPAGTLNLLYGPGSGSPTETGLNIASNGQITFAKGQTFPGTGTVTSVGSGAGLTGGPITGSGTLSIATGGVTNAMLVNPSLTVAAGTDLTGGGTVALGGSTTLNLDTTKVPQLNTANTFTGNQTVNGSLSATGTVQAGEVSTALSDVQTHGVFTNSQQNEYLTSALNGVNFGTEFQSQQPGNYATDALAGGVIVPSTATVHNIDAVAGYINDECSSSSDAQCNAVAGYFAARATVNNGAAIWGINPTVTDAAGLSSTQLKSAEFGMSVLGSPSVVIPLSVAVLPSTGTIPGAPSMPFTNAGVSRSAGLELFAYTTNTNQFGAGIVTSRGFAPIGIQLDASCTIGACGSQTIKLGGVDSGGTSHVATLQGDSLGDALIQPASNRVTVLGTGPIGFSSLPACSSSLEGAHQAVNNNSSAPTWGSNCNGTGSTHVECYCDGTNWTVAAQ